MSTMVRMPWLYSVCTGQDSTFIRDWSVRALLFANFISKKIPAA